MRGFCLGFAAAGMLLVLGCGGGSSVAEVSGEVTVDGQLVNEGVIRFTPVDGKTKTASALIEGGKYKASVPYGKHKVEINAPKLPKGVTSTKPAQGGTLDSGESYLEWIPERYNLKSELVVDVNQSSQQVPFALKGK